jgi:uncharacterized protein CbrC (UPF0167 family)
MGKGSMIVKHFQCSSCEGEGKITVKGDDFKYEDVVYCPLCSADIYEEDIDEDEQ